MRSNQQDVDWFQIKVIKSLIIIAMQSLIIERQHLISIGNRQQPWNVVNLLAMKSKAFRRKEYMIIFRYFLVSINSFISPKKKKNESIKFHLGAVGS